MRSPSQKELLLCQVLVSSLLFACSGCQERLLLYTQVATTFLKMAELWYTEVRKHRRLLRSEVLRAILTKIYQVTRCYIPEASHLHCTLRWSASKTIRIRIVFIDYC
jgi:hypothetical protein